MVLAAGLGLRMQPLTLEQPKALIRVGSKTLIDHALDRLAEAKVSRAVVNVHHKGNLLIKHLRDRKGSPRVFISDERDLLLETGGGVQQALPILGASSFFVANCDSLFLPNSVNPFRLLQDAFVESAMDALLLLVKHDQARFYEGKGDFFSDANGRLSRRGASERAPYIFTGVQILKASLFSQENPEIFSLNRIFDFALQTGKLYGVVYPAPWFHIGTPDAIPPTERFIKHKNTSE